MATSVFTGWRTVTPGMCECCGSTEDWDCDGRGTVFCECQRCPECGGWDGHDSGCPILEEARAEADEDRHLDC